MDFKLALERGWKIIQLDKETIREVSGDDDALLPALLFTAIGAVLGTLLTMNPMIWAGALVVSLVMLLVFTGILHLLAGLFGGSGPWIGLLRAYGHGSGLLSWAGIVPIVGSLVGLWGIPVAVICVEELYGLPRGKAIAVVLIPVVILALLACAGAAMLGLGMAAMFAHMSS